MQSPRRMAIAYDFDGTLSPGNMQDYDFIPELGMTPDEFWAENRNHAKEHDMDEILSYMELMITRGQLRNVSFNRQRFVDLGSKIELFPGIITWFDRMNVFAAKHNLQLEHYIISSGLREMIAGTPIAHHFKYIFASGFRYDQHDVATWPALAVNYTTKTQYLFRINKGIENSYDNQRINQYIPEKDRPIPFRNMIFLGDGETDVPSMKMISYQGGHAIAVYPPNKPDGIAKAQRLLQEKRADFAFEANYENGSTLSNAIQSLIQKIAIENQLIDGQ